MRMDAYDRWMVRSNVERIQRGEATAEATIDTLRAGGYDQVADAVAEQTTMTYRIVRFHQDFAHPDHGKVIKEGLTLEQAQEHCSDPATQGRDSTGEVEWFDGFHREET